MAQPDYPKTTNERLWIVKEVTYGTLVYPAVTDAMIPLPGLNLPAVQFVEVPTQERNPSAGVRTLIQRKKQPSQGTVPFYAKIGQAAGTPPSMGLLFERCMGLETISGGVSVTYNLGQDTSQFGVTVYQYIDNAMRIFPGTIVNTAQIEGSGSEEGKFTFGLWLFDEGFVGTTTLNGGIDNVVTTITVTDSTRFVLPDAPNAKFRIQIDSETLEVTGINYSTHVLNVVRAQAGTSAASHSNGAEVAPWVPGADSDPADTILPLTLGDINMAAPLTTMRVISFQVTVDNHWEARLDEYAQNKATGVRRTQDRRQVTGEMKFYARQVNQSIISDLVRRLERSTVWTMGSLTPRPRLRINQPKLRVRGLQIDGGGNEFIITVQTQALESTSGNDELNLVMD